MNFQSALEAVKNDHTKSYIGLCIRPYGPKFYLDIYNIYISELDEEPDWVSIGFEGGLIFDHACGGEEDYFSLDEVPEEAKHLFYKSSAGIPELFGYLPEYVLFTLFPELPDPESLWEKDERSNFIKLAQERVLSWGIE